MSGEGDEGRGGRLTHVDASGEARMVGVGNKPESLRRAIAEARVRMLPETLGRLRAGDAPKGDVLATARLAGIMAAKRTSELIPLCHAVALTRVAVAIELGADGEDFVRIEATAEAFDRTGVEMEALLAASVSALTLYDMLKAIDRGMTIEAVALVEKSGGRSGRYVRERAGEPSRGAP